MLKGVNIVGIFSKQHSLQHNNRQESAIIKDRSKISSAVLFNSSSATIRTWFHVKIKLF